MMADRVVTQRIERTIGAHPLVVFMRGTPMFPLCGDSAFMVQALSALNAPVHCVNIEDDPALAEGVKIYAGYSRLPQLFINGRFVASCDALRDKADPEMLERYLLEQGLDPHILAGK